jgi:hypothetical protein
MKKFLATTLFCFMLFNKGFAYIQRDNLDEQLSEQKSTSYIAEHRLRDLAGVIRSSHKEVVGKINIEKILMRRSLEPDEFQIAYDGLTNELHTLKTQWGSHYNKETFVRTLNRHFPNNVHYNVFKIALHENHMSDYRGDYSSDSKSCITYKIQLFNNQLFKSIFCAFNKMRLKPFSERLINLDTKFSHLLNMKDKYLECDVDFEECYVKLAAQCVPEYKEYCKVYIEDAQNIEDAQDEDEYKEYYKVCIEDAQDEDEYTLFPPDPFGCAIMW